MTLVAGDILTNAVARAFPFIRETDVAPGQLLRIMAGLDQEVTHLYSLHAPERMDTVGIPINVVFAQNPVGYQLPSGYTYSNFKWIDNNGFVWPINIVPENRYDHPGLHPAGIIRGFTFIPADPAEVRWTNLGAGGAQGTRQFFQGNGDTITFNYIPLADETTDLTGPGSQLVSPDEARPYITAALIMHLLMNSAEMVPQTRIQLAASLVQQRKNDLLMNMMKRTETRGRGFEQP